MTQSEKIEFVAGWHASPINLGFAIHTSGLSSNWQIDVTMDDPTMGGLGFGNRSPVFDRSFGDSAPVTQAADRSIRPPGFNPPAPNAKKNPV